MTDLSTQPALEPCPWCKSTDHLILQAVGSMTADMPARPHRVICTHIDHGTVCGPVEYGAQAARAAWNTRPASDREARLEAALRKYGRHDVLRAIVGGYGYCTCGFDAALSEKDVTP